MSEEGYRREGEPWRGDEVSLALLLLLPGWCDKGPRRDGEDERDPPKPPPPPETTSAEAAYRGPAEEASIICARDVVVYRAPGGPLGVGDTDRRLPAPPPLFMPTESVDMVRLL